MRRSKSYFYISGGFGNLLFQYVGYRFLQDSGARNLYVKTILIQKTWLTSNILNWNIHANESNSIFTSSQIDNKRLQFSDISRLFVLRMSRIVSKPIMKMKYVHTKDNFIPNGLKAYMGYFQNLDHYGSKFWKYSEEISHKLNVNNPKDRLAVHMRFGDSQWAKNHTEYYSEIRLILKGMNKKIFFVSDDHYQCSLFANSCKIEYEIYASSMIKEFIFIAESSVCICAPSTFSWWAAMLKISQKEDVYMPVFFKERFGIESAKIKFL